MFCVSCNMKTYFCVTNRQPVIIEHASPAWLIGLEVEFHYTDVLPENRSACSHAPLLSLHDSKQKRQTK